MHIKLTMFAKLTQFVREKNTINVEQSFANWIADSVHLILQIFVLIRSYNSFGDTFWSIGMDLNDKFKSKHIEDRNMPIKSGLFGYPVTFF